MRPSREQRQQSNAAKIIFNGFRLPELRPQVHLFCEAFKTAAAARPASRRTARKRRAAACTFTAALLRCSRIASWLKNSNIITVVDSCRGGADGETVRW